MFSEILKIIPKLDDKALRDMERNLSSRFMKVAKGFGKGIAGIFKGGGLIGAGLALVDKLLNPLKDTQEAIDRMLSKSDDIATNAGQFDTTTGRLFKLVQLAKSTGLDQDNLFTLITKFQTAVAEARANPSQPSAVRNYTAEQDTAVAFFEFIQALQKMDKSQQVLVQSQVFGEKQILRMADFLQTDFGRKMAEVGLDKTSSDKFTTSIEKLAGLNDMADALTARREAQDVIAKAGVINSSMINARDQSERIALQKENERIKSYNDLAAISDTSNKIMGLIEQGLAMIGSFINVVTPTLQRMADSLSNVMKSPTIRGFMKFLGKDE